MLLYISLLTAALSIILAFYNRRFNKNALFLSLFFILFSFYGLSHYFALYGKSAFWMAIFYYHFSPLFLLLGPLLYFYINGTLSDWQGLRWKDGWHFIPAIIHLINILPYYFRPFTFKIELSEAILNNLDIMRNVSFNLLYSTSWSFIERPVLLFVYVLYSFKILWDYHPAKLNTSSSTFKQYRITYRWLVLLLTTVLIIAVNFFLLSFLLVSQQGVISTSSINVPMHLITGIAFFIMVASLLLFPQILYGIPIYQQATSPTDSSLPSANKSNPANNGKSKVSKEGEEDPFIEMAANIKSYMENERPYLNTQFSITDLSIALKAPQHHLLFCFNNILKLKFTDFRTSLRIDYAKEILLNGEGSQLSIEGISAKSGFSSRSSFYNAFKASTGLTPGEYILEQRGSAM